MRFLLGVLLLTIAVRPAHPYDNEKSHPAIVANAWVSYCQAHPQVPRCKPEGEKQAPRAAKFLMYGAKMEDSFSKGGSYDYMGVKFDDEDDADTYSKCSVTAGLAKAVVKAETGGLAAADVEHPYCTHYWFVGYAGPEGACAGSVTGATNNKAAGHCWPSLYKRGALLFGRAKRYYAEHKFDQAYYWLGRTAHLLADAGVPFHVIPHDPTSNIELAHRCYETLVMRDLQIGPIKPAEMKSGELRDIFEAVRARSEEAAAAQGFVAIAGSGAKVAQERDLGLDLSDLQTVEMLATGGKAVGADVMRPEIHAKCEKVIPNWRAMAKDVVPTVLGQTQALYERFFADVEAKAH